MGVDRTDYLMFGTDLGFEGVDYDSIEAEIDGAPDRRFDAVYDGMSGKYCIVGKIIATSDPYEGFEMAKIDPEKMDFKPSDLATKVSEAFSRKILPGDFSLILFSHFS